MAGPNKYYAPGEQRAERVNDLFGRIARRYDFLNDLQSFGLHRHWKRRLVRMAAPKPGEKALDVCCGTGDIAFALAREGMEVTGLDFSRPMLEVAEGRKKALAQIPGKVEFVEGDAQRLPFAENTFDVVTVGYGLRNLTDWRVGLQEMWRVARPGGRLLVLDFAKPDNRLWRSLYFGYLRGCVPVFGKIFCGDAAAYSYILESLTHYPAQRGVEAEMQALGCSEVQVVTLLGGVMSINYGEK